MSAIIFIVDTLLPLALFVVLARLLLQWARADFRNPICQAVVRVTNPLILPLRRILPPVGKVDTASVVAVHHRRDRLRRDHLCVERLGWPDPLCWIAVHRARHRAHDARDLFLGNLPVRTAQSDRSRRLLARAIGARQRLRADAAAVPTPDSRRSRASICRRCGRASRFRHPDAAALLIWQVACGHATVADSAAAPPHAAQSFCRLLSATWGARTCDTPSISALLRNTPYV